MPSLAHEFLLLFESAVVVVEVLTVYIYLTGLLPKNAISAPFRLLGYVTFGLILGVISVCYPNMIVLPVVTIAGIFALAMLLYKSPVLSAFFVSFLCLMLAVAIEAVVSVAQAWMAAERGKGRMSPYL